MTLAALTLRVQAVNGTVRGPFSSVTIAAPTIVIGDRTVALQSLIDGLKYQVTTLQDQVKQQSDQVTQLLASLFANQAATSWLDKRQLRTELFAQAGNAKASIAQLQSVMVNEQTAFAEFQTIVSATFGPAFSSVSTVSDAVATLDGYTAAQYAVTLNVNGYATGFNLVNGGPGTSTFVVAADHFQIQLPGFNGNAPYDLFTTGLVAGVPSVGIHGNLILDGIITATMMNVGTLSAITANLGAVTAGTLTDPAGTKMRIDLNAGRIEIFDNT